MLLMVKREHVLLDNSSRPLFEGHGAQKLGDQVRSVVSLSELDLSQKRTALRTPFDGLVMHRSSARKQYYKANVCDFELLLKC